MEEEDIPTITQAFIVPPFDIRWVDLSRPPKTGEEYLQRVIHEVKTKAAVVVAPSTAEKWRAKCIKKEEPAKEKRPQMYLVSSDVQDSIIADFSQIRLTVSNYKLKYASNAVWLQSKPDLPQDKNSWLLFVFGKVEVRETICEEDYSSGRPLLKILLAMPQPTIWKLLEFHLMWLEEGLVDVLRCAPWIYALLACLEMPLNGDIFHILRELARYFIGLLETIDNLYSEELYSINVIVTLITHYFQQFDLIESNRMNY